MSAPSRAYAPLVQRLRDRFKRTCPGVTDGIHHRQNGSGELIRCGRLHCSADFSGLRNVTRIAQADARGLFRGQSRSGAFGDQPTLRFSTARV